VQIAHPSLYGIRSCEPQSKSRHDPILTL